MGFWEFYGRCLRQAFTGKFGIAESISGVGGLFMIPLGTYLDKATELQAYFIWAPFWLFIGAFIMAVVLGFVRAPVDIHNAVLEDVRKLKLTIHDAEKYQTALNQLWLLRRSGVELRNRVLTNADEISGWSIEKDLWHTHVVIEADKISQNLSQWLSLLDQTTQGIVVNRTNIIANNPDYETELKVMSEVLHRLQRFLERDLVWPKAGVDTCRVASS